MDASRLSKPTVPKEVVVGPLSPPRKIMYLDVLPPLLQVSQLNGKGDTIDIPLNNVDTLDKKLDPFCHTYAHVSVIYLNVCFFSLFVYFNYT